MRGEGDYGGLALSSNRVLWQSACCAACYQHVHPHASQHAAQMSASNNHSVHRRPSHKISYKGSTRCPLCRMFKIGTFIVGTLRQVECLQGDITVIACINSWSICFPVHQRCSQFSKGIRVQQGDICSIRGRPAQLWLRSLSRRHSLSFKLQCRLCERFYHHLSVIESCSPLRGSAPPELIQSTADMSAFRPKKWLCDLAVRAISSQSSRRLWTRITRPLRSSWSWSKEEL